MFTPFRDSTSAGNKKTSLQWSHSNVKSKLYLVGPFRKIIGLTIYFLLVNQGYAATEPTEGTENSAWIIFLVIVILSLFAAVFLTAFAKQTSYIGEKKAEKIKKSDESLSSVILGEIDGLASSEHHKKQIVETISNLFQEEFKKRVNTATKEVSQKYETVIKEQNQILTRTQQKYNQVDSEKKQTESIIRSIAEGLVVVNNRGEVLLMNPVAKKLLGVKESEQKGKPNLSNMGDEYLVSLRDPTKENQEIIIQSSKDDTKKVLRASSAVIENEEGKTVGMVSVLSDVTKQRELEELKSNFVSSVSHELRTPLVSIQKSVDLILSKTAGPLTETQEKFLNITDRNLKMLTHLINDILDLSKLESKKMKLELNPTPIGKIIDDACEGLKSWADSKYIRIEKMVPSDLPKVNMDSFRIIQVLNNLIGNAIKFTPQNGLITVKVHLPEQGNKIEISVADTGIGIAETDLDKVFDKFQQCGERIATDISGTGLGLSISKEIVQLHKGEIWAESKKGQGAKFTFTLPLSS